MPTLVLNSLGSHPAIVFNSANSTALTNTSAVSLTYSAWSGVYEYTGSGLGMIYGAAGEAILGYNNPNGLFQPGAGGVNFTFSTNAVHAVQATVNGSNGNVYVDGGSATSSAAGTNSVNYIDIGLGNGFYWDGPLFEIASWSSPAVISSTDAANLYNNQHSYWGF
jgi:hypothetical protein